MLREHWARYKCYVGVDSSFGCGAEFEKKRESQNFIIDVTFFVYIQ